MKLLSICLRRLAVGGTKAKAFKYLISIQKPPSPIENTPGTVVTIADLMANHFRGLIAVRHSHRIYICN